MQPKWNQNWCFFGKRDFVEIVLPPTREHDFQGSGPPKMKPKRVEKRPLKKRYEKHAFLMILGIPKKSQKSLGAGKKKWASLFRTKSLQNAISKLLCGSFFRSGRGLGEKLAFGTRFPSILASKTMIFACISLPGTCQEPARNPPCNGRLQQNG